ncbi:MAG TPA: nucleotidyltransferase family protein [Vicinamibacterales bacterium]|jgi:NDP-sugar pyrophosphorylase family protein|nr:nucleotidyltransferase family protein [Vicinamibacterales bacterium]
MKGVILAAGHGTRLGSLTVARPKPMLPVCGRPLLEHTIRWLRRHGIASISINLHHCPLAVIEYFGNGSQFQVDIAYSVEETLHGTAGGVKRMAALFASAFVVVYGDVLTDFDLRDLLAEHANGPSEPHLTMCLYRVANPTACGIVALEQSGRITRFVEKPSAEECFSDLANSGVMVVDRELLEYIPDDRPSDLGADLLPSLLRAGVPVCGWPLPTGAYLIDIGTPENYERASRDWPPDRAGDRMGASS